MRLHAARIPALPAPDSVIPDSIDHDSVLTLSCLSLFIPISLVVLSTFPMFFVVAQTRFCMTSILGSSYSGSIVMDMRWIIMTSKSGISRTFLSRWRKDEH